MKKLLILLWFLPAFCLGQGINVTHMVMKPVAAAGGGEESADIEVRTYVFETPNFTGNEDFQIPSWTSTPKAAKFVIVGVDSEGDGYTDYSHIGIGFADGTNENAVASTAENGDATMDVGKAQTDTACIKICSQAGSDEINAGFVSWLEGGVRVNFKSVLEVTQYRIIITFFAGDDVSAKVGYGYPGEHIEDVGFESNLIFFACAGDEMGDQAASSYTFSTGVATWDGVTLKQGVVATDWDDAVGTSASEFYVSDTSVASQVFGASITWASKISDVDASGWNFADDNTDDIGYLALKLTDGDADMGVTTIPTSGNIDENTPGFEPQIVGFLLSNHTAKNTLSSAIDACFGVGEDDGTSEHSLSVTGEDDVGTSNHTSVRDTDAIHLEDADQTTIYNGAVSLTADGFDVTMATNPGSAMYYIWWAID